MMKCTYSTLTLALISTLPLLTPAAAQFITGSASISGNITISATIFSNAGGNNTPINPPAQQRPNTVPFITSNVWGF